MSKLIFKNPEWQARFEREGFVQIPLLQEEDLTELRALYAHHFSESAEGFFSSSYLNDFSRKKEISQQVAAVLQRRIPEVFQNYRVFGSAFLSKTAGHRSAMPLHQDWTIVDESEYVAVNIWTPLQDTNHANGSLAVLPGSHAFAPVRRSPTIPFFWSGYEEEMEKSLTHLEVRAGEAVVLNQALVHASPPNTTDRARLAITTGLLSADAPMEFYFQKAPGVLEVFRMPDDFLLQFENFHESIFERPTFGEPVGEVAYEHLKRSREEVMAYLEEMRPEPEPAVAVAGESGFWHRLKGLLKGGQP